MTFLDYSKFKEKLKKINFNLHHNTFQEVLLFSRADHCITISVSSSSAHQLVIIPVSSTNGAQFVMITVPLFSAHQFAIIPVS